MGMLARSSSQPRSIGNNLRRQIKRQFDDKDTAHTQGARYLNRAVHHLYQLLTNRQPQTKALPIPCAVFFARIRLKSAADKFWRHADTGVMHFKPQRHFIDTARNNRHQLFDAAFIGKFKRIGQQIIQQLLQAVSIANHQ